MRMGTRTKWLEQQGLFLKGFSKNAVCALTA
jgi:hypothetical protein